MKLLAGTILLALAPAAFAANSLIRVDCMEGTAGAKVSINGKYQFTCKDFQKEPISLQAGDYTITAVLPISKEYERVFTDNISLQPGVPQRIRVALPAQTLTAFGREEEARRQKLEEAEEQRQRVAALKQDMEGAESGDPDAMQRLAERYRTGDGVAQDSEKARQLSQQAQEISKKQARDKQIADLKEQLNSQSLSYSYNTSALTPSQIPLWPIATSIGFVPTWGDLSQWSSIASKRKKIKQQLEQLETHAARWANPDSMVAQAYDVRHAAD